MLLCLKWKFSVKNVQMFLNFLTPFPHQVKIIDKTKILGIFKSSPQPKVFYILLLRGNWGGWNSRCHACSLWTLFWPNLVLYWLSFNLVWHLRSDLLWGELLAAVPKRHWEAGGRHVCVHCVPRPSGWLMVELWESYLPELHEPELQVQFSPK